MTDHPPTVGSWSDLKLNGGNGDRHPFFPLRDLRSDEPITFTVQGDPEFNPQNFHGQYSMVELDVWHNGSPYRLCVSGTRLARALAPLKPTNGDRVTLTPRGEQKQREWKATIVKAGPPQVALAI